MIKLDIIYFKLMSFLLYKHSRQCRYLYLYILYI